MYFAEFETTSISVSAFRDNPSTPGNMKKNNSTIVFGLTGLTVMANAKFNLNALQFLIDSYGIRMTPNCMQPTVAPHFFSIQMWHQTTKL
ncbi:10850_t:CDS:2 [Ambispora leptoticha]|uniref:10850_t:CDS:1 n=1 Tax=Ambispora leptoticha TaxID=144679 RepID=A0A9N8W613_9GLOM|nr:10850_t:CDS:2 [Ambispora leptoticha]